jgi:SAM-dependent methyltransferase
MTEPTPRRQTFDREAEKYHQARPGYPDPLFEDLFQFSNIPRNGMILEIGCGTGQATIPIARKGYAVDCVELGANMAAAARKNLAQYPKVKVAIGSFEEIPLKETAYDLVISATAFHWVDPKIGYLKVAKILKPGGTIALFWNLNVRTERSDGFVQSVQRVYQQVVPEMAQKFSGLPYPDTTPLPARDQITQTGLFGGVTVRKYSWEQEYTSHAYLDLLNTYSDHLALKPETRSRLFVGIQDHIDSQFGGRILKEYLTVLYLARCKGDSNLEVAT